jgi:hypothetical protein
VQGTGYRHAPSGCPLAGGWVVQLGARCVDCLEIRVDAEVPASNQNLAVREQRRTVVYAGRPVMLRALPLLLSRGCGAYYPEGGWGLGGL